MLRFDSFHSITPKCLSVNTFFQLFFFSKISLKKERRKRDLNPRAGCPTYTLSRGASSASWVFLHFWSAFPRYSVLRPFCRRIVHYSKVCAECQRLFLFFYNYFFPFLLYIRSNHYISCNSRLKQFYTTNPWNTFFLVYYPQLYSAFLYYRFSFFYYHNSRTLYLKLSTVFLLIHRKRGNNTVLIH